MRPTCEEELAGLKSDLECIALQRDALRALLDQVDDVLVVNWITVKDGDYRKALHDLVTWNIQVHDDPSASEVAKKRADELAAVKADRDNFKRRLLTLLSKQGQMELDDAKREIGALRAKSDMAWRGLANIYSMICDSACDEKLALGLATSAVDRLVKFRDDAITLAEKHGWNGVDNSKILTSFLEDALQENARAKRRLEKTVPFTATEFQDKQHDLMMAVQMGIVAELERAGFDPCPAIKIAAEATSQAWDIWGKFMAENERLRKALLDHARHEKHCNRQANPLDLCSCGLDNALDDKFDPVRPDLDIGPSSKKKIARLVKIITDTGMTAQEFAKAYDALSFDDINELRKKKRAPEARPDLIGRNITP